MSERGGGAAAAALTAVGALALAGAVSAPWAQSTVARALDDVEITETVVTRGVELTRLAFPLGVALVAAGVALVALGARARRVVGTVVALAGAVALADVAAGVLAARAEGSLTAAPGLAAAAAVTVAAGGLLAWRSRRPSGLPPRFDLDAEAADDEWDAAVEPDERDP